MGTNHYALETNGKNRLDISWEGVFYKGDRITVSLDGDLIGEILDKEACKAGQEFSLPDGSIIKVHLEKKAGFHVHRDGQQLFDSVLQPQTLPKSPAQRKRAYEIAYGTVFFLGGLNFVFGLITVFLKVDFLLRIGIGYLNILYGLVFLALGFFAQRRSNIALIIAIILYGLDGFVSLLSLISQGSFMAISSFGMHVIFITPMIQGVGAIKTLQREERRKT